jgi:5-methylcytosine-specific restriction endonuclease McrA
MTTTSTNPPPGHLEPDGSSSFTDPAEILAFARARKADANAAEVDVLVAAAEWAEHHATTLWAEDPAVHARAGGDERPLLVAGDGVPSIREFAVPDFAAALNLSTDAGRQLIGDALELRHRLLRVWDAVGEGGCPVWRARRIAQATISLPVEGAGFVDAQLADLAHSVSLPQLDRLIAEAKARYAPHLLEEEARRAADGRRFDLTLDDPLSEFAGTAHVDGILDVADALDLAAAVSRAAAQLAALGSEESLDVRRAIAVGELARQQLALDPDPDPDPDQPAGMRGAGRAVTLHVHVSADALTNAGTNHGTDPEFEDDSGTLRLARVEETGTVVTADQVAAWCRAPATTTITVKPVIDLADRVHVAQYEVPDRIAERTDLRDVHCVFPYCTRPARRCGKGCDKDHIRPWHRGGPTATDNIAALCRRHHRLKTHTAWDYTPVEDATYLWTSPHGLRFVRDHTGTRDVTPPDWGTVSTQRDHPHQVSTALDQPDQVSTALDQRRRRR